MTDYEEQFKTLDCLFVILLVPLFPSGSQIFYELPGVYKAGSLILWGPQLYFVIFCNGLKLIASLFFFTSVGHSYAKHIAAQSLLTCMDLETGLGTEDGKIATEGALFQLRCELDTSEIP